MGKREIHKKRALAAALVILLLAGCGSSPERRGRAGETDYEESQSDHQEAEHTEVTDDTEKAVMTGEENMETAEPETTITLTEKGKSFLAKLCNEMDDFHTDSILDETFWRDFLFHSYTGASLEDAETEQVYREDLGFEETVVKVGLQEAEAYVKLVFGMDLPDVKPSFEDMEKGQTAFYYKDGSYYIGVSSLPDDQYTYLESIPDNENNADMIVKYTIDFMGDKNVGTVTFTISPEENENGFIIRSKNTEFVK